LKRSGWQGAKRPKRQDRGREERPQTRDRSRERTHRGPERDSGEARETRETRSWIYGLNPVLEALRSGREVKSVFILAGRRDKLDEIEQEVARRGVPVKKTDENFFESRFPKGHQGIAAAVAPREYASLEDILVIPAAKNETPLFLVLDLIEDPRNFGAILRVADAGGVHGVVIQSHRSATLTPEAVKASAGASEYVPVAMVVNIKHAIKAMKDEGITVIGTEAATESTVWDADLSGPVAIVIGSEGHGLRRTVREDCDILINLPMKGSVNSLNASVAAGIVIFETVRQRNRSGL